jgi:competence protein ComEC
VAIKRRGICLLIVFLACLVSSCSASHTNVPSMTPPTSIETTGAQTSLPVTNPSAAALTPAINPKAELDNTTADPAEKKKLEVHFIDVGQGDSILVRAPEGLDILIDGGEARSGVVDYLERLGISQLDLVILTHPDSDHLGGVVDILDTLPVTKIVTNGQPHSTPLYEKFLDDIANSAIEYSEVKQGVKLTYNDLILNVLNPVSIQDDNLNNNSLVIRLEYGSVSFMLTGDVQADGEAQMLASHIPLASTILKVAHHGSASSSTPAFLEAVHPATAVYTAGLGNQSGFPSPDTIANLTAVGARIYGTDQNGTVVITTDGIDYSLETEKQGDRSGPVIPVEPEATETLMPTTAVIDTPTVPPAPTLAISVTSLTSPIAPNARASLKVQTKPGAECSITVNLKSGPSHAAGLGSQTASSDGTCAWSWKIGSNTAQGTWSIVVSAELNGESVSAAIPFEVKK